MTYFKLLFFFFFFLQFPAKKPGKALANDKTSRASKRFIKSVFSPLRENKPRTVHQRCSYKQDE